MPNDCQGFARAQDCCDRKGVTPESYLRRLVITLFPRGRASGPGAEPKSKSLGSKATKSLLTHGDESIGVVTSPQRLASRTIHGSVIRRAHEGERPHVTQALPLDVIVVSACRASSDPRCHANTSTTHHAHSYVVPVNVLEHFLEDVRRHDGRYLGFPRLGVSLQNLESPALRGSLKMSPQQTGIMVTAVEVRGTDG